MTNLQTRTRTQKYFPPPRKRLGPLALCGALVLSALAGGLFAAPASAADAEATEGRKVVFKIEKPNFSNGNFRATFRYSYKTEDDDATAGDDYKAVSGKVVFKTNTVSRKIRVETYEDDVDEGDGETFRLTLTDPQIRGRCYNSVLHNVTLCWKSADDVLPDEIELTGEILEP